MPDPQELDRHVVRFVVDTLVTPDQVELVRRILARALCGSDDDHVGPCRLAWDIWHVSQGDGERGVVLGEAETVAVRAALGALEVVPGAVATADLVAELERPGSQPLDPLRRRVSTGMTP